MKLSEIKSVTLVNPWTHQPVWDKAMTWAEIKSWAEDSVHPNDLGEWLRAARAAYKTQDGDTLGTMIIGS